MYTALAANMPCCYAIAENGKLDNQPAFSGQISQCRYTLLLWNENQGYWEAELAARR
ncbi:hypothetical protein [Vibrio albus]|uniref:hypothetical protein n=1 Tax=Vibrio albus TaxID=2200953 RepID=UPI001C627072|nr:hypothetical protein [Vibrio albus]